LESDRQRIVVLGAGGHAKVVLELLWAMGTFEVVGLLAAHPADKVMSVPVLGGDELLPELLQKGVTAAAVAIGSNAARQRAGENLLAMGYMLPALVHPSAFVSPSATVGCGAVVMARAIVGTLAAIGELAIINTGAVVEHDARIGTAAHIAPRTALAGGVSVGDRALVGIGSAVCPDLSIGDDAVVGAGSAVVADVAAGTTVGGTPARPLQSR
jgi:UDP-perosamine 4-acetyltransferase